jgi:ribosome biogenesis ATPase
MTRVVIIGSTNRPDSLDPALRRAGRFDHEISLGIPNEVERRRILTMMCRKLTSLDSNFDLDELVLKTPGYVGADLSALLDEALVAALNR